MNEVKKVEEARIKNFEAEFQPVFRGDLAPEFDIEKEIQGLARELAGALLSDCPESWLEMLASHIEEQLLRKKHRLAVALLMNKPIYIVVYGLLQDGNVVKVFGHHVSIGIERLGEFSSVPEAQRFIDKLLEVVEVDRVFFVPVPYPYNCGVLECGI